MLPTITALSLSPTHSFSKENRPKLNLIAAFGAEGDAHAGQTVKHRSRVKQDPSQPNLRQIHLIHSELHEELQAKGFKVFPGTMGENITTKGIDLLGLPTNTVLQLGKTAKIQVTGLRNPCAQLDDFQTGLLKAVLDRDENGELVRKAGIMATVLVGGEVFVGDEILVSLPNGPFQPLERV